MQATPAPKFRVLLIGSGLMTPPLVDYMTSFKDTHITVASNLPAEASNLCKRAPKYMDSTFLDVGDVRRKKIFSFLFQKYRS
jgi:hypothetical protein